MKDKSAKEFDSNTAKKAAICSHYCDSNKPRAADYSKHFPHSFILQLTPAVPANHQLQLNIAAR
jgi:hypothetical protein